MNINDVKTVGVLDTGSAVSLLREDEARKLGCAVMQLDDVQCVAANGTDVTVAGQVEVPVVMGSVFAVHQFHIVEHLSDPVLLGMDLLRKIGATIHCGTGELSVSGEKIPVHPPGHDVVTKEELTCPPRTESMFVIRRVATAEAHVFEPMDVGGVELVAALYNDVACQGVPVRVLNLKEEEVLIPAGTVLGKASPAQEVIAPGPADLGAGAEAVEEDVGYKLPTGEHLYEDEDQFGSVDTGTKAARQEDQCPRLPSVEHLQREERDRYTNLLQEFSDVFSQSADDIGSYTGKHQLVIDTAGARPVRQRPYRTPLHLRDLLKRTIESLHQQGVIEDSSSPWSSPVVMIKKRDGDLRFCCDYRAVNTVIKHDSYPLPKIDDLLHSTRGSTVFSVLDQRAAYWAVPISPESRESDCICD